MQSPHLILEGEFRHLSLKEKNKTKKKINQPNECIAKVFPKWPQQPMGSLVLKGWSYISIPSPPTLLFPPFLASVWHLSDSLLTCWQQTNPKGRKRKQQFSAGLTARNVHGRSKTALFGSRKLLAWLPSGETSSQAPQAAQEEQGDF